MPPFALLPALEGHEIAYTYSTRRATIFHLPFAFFRCHDAPMKVFTYGSLMIPSVMAAVTGKRFQAMKACLKNYARFRVEGQTYPGIVHQTGASTTGVVYWDVDDRSLKLLDDFEGELYQRTSVRVEVVQHGTLIAETYLFNPTRLQLLSSEAWDEEEFKREHLEEFLRNYRGFSILPKHA